MTGNKLFECRLIVFLKLFKMCFVLFFHPENALLVILAGMLGTVGVGGLDLIQQFILVSTWCESSH